VADHAGSYRHVADASAAYKSNDVARSRDDRPHLFLAATANGAIARAQPEIWFGAEASICHYSFKIQIARYHK